MAIAADFNPDNSGEEVYQRDLEHMADDAGLGASPEALQKLVQEGSGQDRQFAEDLLQMQDIADDEAYRAQFDAMLDQVAEEEDI